MSTAAIPPLPAGYQLDNAGEVPPLPKGYTLDSQAAQPADKSFLEKMATQPSKFSHLNPLRYSDEIGQGMAQGAEMLVHPVNTAKNIYQHFGEPNPPDTPFSQIPDMIAQGWGQAATAGVVGKGIEKVPALSDVAQAAAQKASRAADMVRDVTPKQAARVGGGAVTAGTLTAAGHPIAAIPAATLAAERMGRVAEIVLGKDRANAPIFSRAPDLSLDNITDALAQTIAADRARFTEMQAKGLGEIPGTGAKPAAQSGEALATNPTSIGPEPPKGGKAAPKFNAEDRAAARSLLQDALQHGSRDVVSKAIPAEGATAANSKFTQARVDFFLKQGDVAKAEAALDQGAKQANPSWQPPQRQIVPSTNEIRARVQGEAASASKADQLDTRALQQEMAEDLQKHGWSAESEARREFIARNSIEFNKSGKSRGYVEGESVKYTKTPGVNVSGKSAPVPAVATDDLTDLLQKSLDEARQRQQGK